MTGPIGSAAVPTTTATAHTYSATLHHHSTWTIEGQPRVHTAARLALRAALGLDDLSPEDALVAIAGLLTMAELHMAVIG